MNAKETQLYSDIDDLLIFAGGYLTVLQAKSKNDKLIKNAERTINKISARYRGKINELYTRDESHPDALPFPFGG